MKVTDKQRKQILTEFEKVADFCANECAQTILNVTPEEIVQDSQTLYDCIVDLMHDIDLNGLVLERLKERMGVK